MSSGNSNGSANLKNYNVGNSSTNSSGPKFGSFNTLSNNTNNSTDFISRLISSSPSKASMMFSTSPSAGSPIYLAETGRRPSGTMSRGMSYIYNNSFLSNNSNNTSNHAAVQSMSSTNAEPTLSPGGSNDMYQPTKVNSFVNNPHSLLPSLQGNSYNTYVDTERSYFQAANEILACDKSWETPNLIAIATPRNLQLLKVSNTDISLETELVMKPSGKTKISTLSDLSFGHQQYGRYLAASTITGAINIYHFDRGTRIKTSLTGHKRAVNSIDFNRITPHLLASGSQDGKILIWDLRTSNSKPSMSLNGLAEAVRCCKFNNKKGNILACVFDSGVVEKWDLRKNTTWDKRINAHTGPSLTVDWHPELDYVVTGGRDKQLQVWNLDSSSHEMKEPSHVIYTSGPIFKAKWCKGRGNNSVMNTDIAVSFFNNDPCVQIWNLNRKFIPKAVFDGHSAQITQILWRTPKHLITCSKDKTLIQYDVLKEREFINNVKNGAFAWNPIQRDDFAFVKQEKLQFQGPFNSNRGKTDTNVVKEEEAEDAEFLEKNTSKNDYKNDSNDNHGSVGNSESNHIRRNYSDDNGFKNSNLNNNEDSYFTYANSYKSHPMLIHNSTSSSITPPDHGMQLYEISNATHNGFSPTMSSSFKFHRPAMLQSRQPSQSRIIHNMGPPPAWITSVHMPLPTNDADKFKFLSTNYIIRVPENVDIIDVCEYNAMLAASVGFFRDSQTWRTIKMSIILDNEVKEEEEIENKLLNFAFEQKSTLRQSESQLGTSYGSESDMVNQLGSEISGSYNKSSIYFNEDAVADDNDVIYEENNDLDKMNVKSVNVSDNLLGTTNSTKSDISNIKSSIKPQEIIKNSVDTFDSNVLASKDVDAGVSNVPVPIEIENKFRNRVGSTNIRPYRYSFTGSSVDFDDEKSGSPMSLSSSPMLKKSRSKIIMSLTNNAIDETAFHVSQSLDTRLSRASDTKSQLTSILKDQKVNDDANANADNTLDEEIKQSPRKKTENDLVPWNPSDMIQQACKYSSERGDVITCATLSFLFAVKYPEAIPPEIAEEWIDTYHELLLRSGYFNNAATILRIASETYENFKTIGQTKTSVKTLCCHCKKPLINEESKNRMTENKTLASFGFWYCDRCHKQQSGCSYCGEPVKGNMVSLIGCGHGGHFGCFRSWFVDQNEKECPLCGSLSVI